MHGGRERHLIRACATKVADGITIFTKSAKATAAQVEAFDRILSNHLLYCTVCDNNNGNCTVHNTTKLLAIEHQKIPFRSKPYEVDNTNPFYRYDPDKCILCGRCVEACQNVEVNETLSINWEDPNPRVLWDGGSTIGESSCVSCGHCVTVCPCNALMEKTMLGHAGFLTSLKKSALSGMIEVVKGIEPETGYGGILQVSEAEHAMREHRIRKTKTVCTYCGVGCSFDVWTKDRHILKVAPEHGPANGISTCVKGKFGWGHINSEDRLTTPLIREGGKFRQASWDEALGLVARRLSEIKTKDGADSLAFISSSKCTNEESYLMQKLARAVIGTNNVDNCSRYCQSPATQGLFRTVGYGGDSGSISDIEKADLVLIIGSNTAESHPVIATRVKSSHKLDGQKLIVSDLRENEMARRADLFLHPKPATDLVWINAVSRYLLDNGLAHTKFLDQWVNGLEKYRKSLAPFTLEAAAQLSGLSEETIKTVAHMIGEEMSIVDSNANYVADAFAKLDFFVVQDIFFSNTCRYADVVLPGAPSLEKEGTFTSTERRIQRLYQVLEPIEGCWPDWKITQEIANRMGAGWHYQHPSEIMDEIASLTPMFAGVNYERLAGYKSLQWPVAPDGTDEPLLYTKRFDFPDGKARLFPVSWIGPTDRPNAEFDLHLNNGRLLEHFHEGNLTYRTEGIREKTPDTFVEVSPELAEERGIQSGTWVQLVSRYGKVRVRALVTDRVQGREMYMPMNSVESPVNRLTSSHADPVTNTPAYKEISVHMNVLPEVGESPLPRINSRFGHPTPQNGVEVERKWKRPDYAPPGNGNGLVQLQTLQTKK